MYIYGCPVRGDIHTFVDSPFNRPFPQLYHILDNSVLSHLKRFRIVQSLFWQIRHYAIIGSMYILHIFLSMKIWRGYNAAVKDRRNQKKIQKKFSNFDFSFFCLCYYHRYFFCIFIIHMYINLNLVLCGAVLLHYFFPLYLRDGIYIHM